MIHALGWFTVYACVVLVAMALWDCAVARWRAYLARQLAPFLVEERRRHVAELESRRQEHQESQEWLMEMHRYAMEQMARRHREELDAAVIEALTVVAPHPIRGGL